MHFDLVTSRFCRNLPPADVALIRTRSESRSFPAGSEIFHEGDKGDGLYIIEEGAVEIVCHLSSGATYLLAQVESGDYFGEMAVFDGEPRSATARAPEDLKTIFVPSDVVQLLLERTPLVGAMLMRDASLRLREFNQRFLRESLRSERLALVERLAHSIVHDFRNPLNVIGIAAELAATESATYSIRRRAKSRIHKQIKFLNHMMQELVDFTRGVQPSLVLPKIIYADYLREILLDLQASASRRGMTLFVASSLPVERVRLDGTRFSRVFSNLAQNAFDAMAGVAEPTLTLRFKTTATHVITEVCDNGIGIPVENLPRLFEPFFTHGKDHGTGLGLSICERIVQDHGGDLAARNNPSGGTTFAFSLPIAPVNDTDQHEEDTVLIRQQDANLGKDELDPD